MRKAHLELSTSCSVLDSASLVPEFCVGARMTLNKNDHESGAHAFCTVWFHSCALVQGGALLRYRLDMKLLLFERVRWYKYPDSFWASYLYCDLMFITLLTTIAFQMVLHLESKNAKAITVVVPCQTGRISKNTRAIYNHL
jgi:hypothetical protein